MELYPEPIDSKKKKKKIDLEALQSSFMRIPRMHIEVARGLLDIGLRETYELIGRSAETLLQEMKKKTDKIPAEALLYLKVAVYFAENSPHIDPKLLEPHAWS